MFDSSTPAFEALDNYFAQQGTGPLQEPAVVGRRAATPLHFLSTDAARPIESHDVATKAKVAESLADFLGYGWAGVLPADGPRPAGAARYVVPSDTIVGLDRARALGIHGIDDVFGGVVPEPFMATKLITHGLVRPGAAAPPAWSDRFCERVLGAVLPGFSVFGADDALLAGERLLQRGAVRVKDPHGVGGGGQWVVHDSAELQARLDAFGAERIAAQGLVLELNLANVVTLSVGQVQAGRLTISYHGTQSLTTNHRGNAVYGGSTLHVVRGAFDELLEQPGLAPNVRLAVRQALCYHRAALASFPGMIASRANYDVAQGMDAEGNTVSGVLEQSWRIGGASGAEVAALHALDADRTLRRVTASTCEVYGAGVQLPTNAWVLYDGDDAQVGRLTKYAHVAGHALA